MRKINLYKSNASWSWRIKLARALWNLTWLFFFRFTPKRLGNKWRVILLRLFGAKVDGDPLILPSCKILQPWKLTLGKGSAIGAEVNIYNYDMVTIGEMSVISQYSYICTGTHDISHPYMPLIWKPIYIGSECWIAADVYIGPGIVINDGAVIGARSVVTKNIPEWTVCVGNPCKPIKIRNIEVLDGEEY